ncbi:hypothetical protein MNBD_ALPHA12-691 [hydrothermal vent metagenome]|uniref:Leucine-binding protein domain-containing protein n=1 Tax=hydrothermal vent metagenome TaxID=652676 RepID=A0A3B0TRD4_9ZZZZ
MSSAVAVNSRFFAFFKARLFEWRKLKWAALALGLAAMTLVSGCSTLSFPQINNSLPLSATQLPNQGLPAAAGQTIGTGPVRVALLLPLSGDVASVGTSMANAAQLAMEFIAQSPNINDNITLVIKDTLGDPNIAAQKASEAVSEGASLILGPLKAESVRAAGAVARSSGVPLIGFSNNSGAAAPGVYLLNVLPNVEVRRTLAYAQSQGRKSFAAIVPNTAFGQIQEGAFRQAASDLGLTVRAVYRFSNEAEARSVIEQAIPFLKQGLIDALFIPDRSTAPSFGVLLEQAGIDRANLMLIGSLDWEGDANIPQTAYLAGAIYPSVDESGLAALTPQYEAKFGQPPHPLSTIAYTATLLANSKSLSMSLPRYDRAQLTRPSGFNGRDGLFRFLPDGRSQYALAIKQIIIGGAQQIDGPKIP